MVEVKRKKGETFDAMLRRMQRRFQESGKYKEAKRRRFFQHNTNRNKRRAGALRRVEMSAHYAYMLKTGQLTEEMLKKQNKPRR